MTPAMQQAILDVFFGAPRAGAARGTPEATLDLPTGERSAPAVNAAFNRRVALIAAHPRGRGPEAQAARMILHQAALQLLGVGGGAAGPMAAAPAPTDAPGPSQTARAPSAPRPATPAPQPPDAELVIEARQMLARAGTIDGAAMQRLTAIALARGLPPEAAVRVVASLAATSDEPQRAAAPRRAPTDRDEATDERVHGEDEGRRLVRIALTALAALVVVVGLAITGIVLLAQSAAKLPSVATPFPTPPVVERELARAALADEAAPADAAQPDPAQILREARSAASAEPKDAQRAFTAANDTVARWWFLLDPGQRTAAAESMVEAFLRVANDPAAADALLTGLTPPDVANPPPEGGAAGAGAGGGGTATLSAEGVARTSWAAGLLSRLARERDLPADQARRVAAMLESVLGRGKAGASTSFVAGARVALATMPMRIVAGPAFAAADGTVAAPPLPPNSAAATFERWERCVRALGEGPQTGEQAENMILDGIETVMVRAAEPTADRAVYAVLQGSAGRLRWRAADPSRRRLVAWFGRADISTADLSVLTGAIVRDSAAEGVDLTMALSPLATPEARAALRDRYAKAWAIGADSVRAGGGGGGRADWAAVSREQIAASQTVSGTLEDLRSAAVLSALSHAAWRKSRGETGNANDLVAQEVPRLTSMILPPVDGAVGGTGGGPGGVAAAFSATDGSWAVRFVTDRNAAAKLASLRELESSSVLGQADADVLVEAALVLGQSDVRRAAQGTLGKYIDQPTVLGAILKTLPRVVRSPGVAEALAPLSARPLPGWQAPAWPAEVRRAVVEALLEKMAGGGTGNTIDALCASIAESYARMAGLEVSPGGVGQADAPAKAAEGASRLYQSTRSRCQRYPSNEAFPQGLDRLDQRRASRLAVAVGPVQRFAAEQTSTLEALAYLVSGERPGTGPEVKALLDALARRRRTSESIAEQIKATEAAMLRLHLLRAGGAGEAGGASQ
ncbi:MAG: hypothetical protein ACKVS8_12890 [Phycisphaerales bacterium]